MKKLLLPLIVVLVLGWTVAVPAFANHGGKDCGGKQCSLKDKGKDCGHGQSSDCQCPIADKILKKSGFLLDNTETLNLTEVQVNKIKSIKHQTKKNCIRQASEMQIFEMDVMEKLSANPIDQEGLNAMIDQATAGWSAGAKQTVQTYVDLKNVLDDDQLAKAKELWTKKK